MATQKLATEKQVAEAMQARINEKVAEELTIVAPGHLPAHHVAGQTEKEKPGDGDPSSRSGSSQGA